MKALFPVPLSAVKPTFEPFDVSSMLEDFVVHELIISSLIVLKIGLPIILDTFNGQTKF